jgi:hypothetical protein
MTLKEVRKKSFSFVPQSPTLTSWEKFPRLLRTGQPALSAAAPWRRNFTLGLRNNVFHLKEQTVLASEKKME